MEENPNNPTAEYYIPDIVSSKIKSKEIAFSVIPTNDSWFGVTYKEDKEMAINIAYENIKKIKIFEDKNMSIENNNLVFFREDIGS